MPLEEVCLAVLGFNFTSTCSDFLLQTPQPPSIDAIEAAVNGLVEIGAVARREELESLTDLGSHLAKLPVRCIFRGIRPEFLRNFFAQVDARVGKMLIYGTIFKCVDPVLTIAASLSTTKDPFLSSQMGDGEASALHSTFLDESSDFLSFVNLWTAVRLSKKSNDTRRFCRDRRLNYGTILEIEENRIHFAEILYNIGFLRLPEWPHRRSSIDEAISLCSQNQNATMKGLVDAVVCGGLFPNVGKVSSSSRSKETQLQHKKEILTVQKSVNSKLHRQDSCDWLTFFDKFATQRRVSVSKTAIVSPISLMLFGSGLEVLHTQRKVRVDGWVELTCAAKTGLLLREIRLCLSQILRTLVAQQTPSKPTEDDDSLCVEIDCIAKLLSAASKPIQTTH